MYKGVIFDFNGTLFFDNDKHILAWGKVSEEIRGHGISEEELHEHINGVPNKQVVSYLFNGTCSEEQMNHYSELKEEYYRDFCKADKPTFHLVKGAEEYFDYLKEHNIPFTIASASIKPNIDFFVESFHLDKWVKPEDIVYDNGEYPSKVEFFKQASKNINVPLSDCLIIEDAISGIESGYKAGCRDIIVMDSANKADEYKKLPGVTRVINDFEELLK